MADSSAGRLYVEVVGDTSGFGREVQTKVNAEIARVRARIKVEADTSSVRREVEAAARAAQGRAGHQLGIDREHLRRNMAAAVTEAAGRIRDAKVQVATKVDSGQLKRDVEGAAAPPTPKSTLTRDLEGGAEDRRVFALHHPAGVPHRDQLRHGVREAVLLEGIGSSLAFLAGGLGQVVGGLYAMAAASGPAVGGLMAIPAAVGAAVQGIGTLLLGFAGVGDAVKALGQAQSAAGASAASSARRRRRPPSRFGPRSGDCPTPASRRR